jgi:KDO2-lipid IV(A) lauroyltransferase
MGNTSMGDRLQDWGARAVLGGALLLPYRWRVPLVGWVVSRVVAPFAGWRGRIRRNLAYVMPDLPEAERERIVRRVADNVGRTLIEIYSGEDFVAHTRDSVIEGPGRTALEAARAEHRPVVLLTAHLGNYDAVRGKLSREGYEMAALFRPMKNAAFHEHYLEAISAIAEPVFPTDRPGITALVRHLKEGGIIGIVADVGLRAQPVLRFFGKPAHTAVASAEWALKYNAEVIPIFGLRQPDGLSFRIHVAKPIPHGAPTAMMQAYNDAVEAVVRKHMDQWFWIHRRWKLNREAELSSGETPP